MNKASEDKLEFYTADPLGGQETAIRRGLTLPQAISAFSRGEAAAIGGDAGWQGCGNRPALG